MKQLILSLIMAVAVLLPFATEAKVCKIKGTNDTIELTGSSHASNTVNLVLSNDGPAMANVHITITVTYRHEQNSSKITKVYTETKRINPYGDTAVTIPINDVVDTYYVYDSFTLDSLTGEKCN